MSVNFHQVLPLMGGLISIGTIIFKMGQHAEKLDVLDFSVLALEKKVDLNHNIINTIYNDISVLKNDISYMKDDLHNINMKLDMKLDNK